MRIRTFVREPEALFWTFGFPILLAIGLGVAFGGDAEERVTVGVIDGSRAVAELATLEADPLVDAELLDEAAAARALRRGEVALVLAGDERLVYRFDPTRPESRLARLEVDRVIQGAAGASRPVAAVEEPQRQRGSRYIDWVIPGLIGLNVMSTGMWGIGFGMVYMRQKKQLKRLSATPMRRSDFLVSQLAARLTFLILEVPPIVLFAWLVFGVKIVGSPLAALAVVLLGAVTFAGLGLLTASRATTIEGVSGLMNVVMFPMFILSGVFFSASRYPEAVQPLIRALPLTAFNDALRAVYNEGLPLASAAVPLAILGAWAVVTFGLALRVFRWR